MRLRKLCEDSDNDYGCGAAALCVLFGKSTRYWQRRILAYRKAHKPPRSSICYRAGELFSPVGRHFTYDNEMRALVGEQLGKTVKFTYPRRKCRLCNLKLKPGTWLVMLSNHFCVMQNGDCFDGSCTGTPQSDFRFPNDIVQSYYQLPDYQNWRRGKTLSYAQQQELIGYVNRARPFHPTLGSGRWFISFSPHTDL